MIECTGYGRLVHDVELKETTSSCVCNFTLAVDEYRTVNGERETHTSFFNFEAWDTGAQTFVNIAKKGDSVFFSARARQNVWMSGETKRSKVVFRLKEFKVFPKSVAREHEEEDSVV